VDVSPRVADASDLDGVVATLTASFLDDPIMSWAFPDRDVRARRLPVMWRHAAGGVFLPGGASTTLPGHDAVAMWRRPGDGDGSEYWEANVGRFIAEMEGDLDRLGALQRVMTAHHPTDDHWYLPAIGTRPDAQGRGLGSVLLAHTLRLADEGGEPAYLEATSPRSRALYARFGFEVVGEIAPDGCPPMWPMWRTPH
jgi:GNAT superfamily N-acetyltransferase